MPNTFKIPMVKTFVICVAVLVSCVCLAECRLSSRPTPTKSHAWNTASGTKRTTRSAVPVFVTGPFIKYIIPLSSNSLRVSWHRIPSPYFDLVVKYKVCYQVRRETLHRCTLSKDVPDAHTSVVILTGLRKETTYHVAIKSATTFGFGRLGTVKSQKTLGDNAGSHYGKHFVLGFTEQSYAIQTRGVLKISIIALFEANVTINAATRTGPLFASYVPAGDLIEYHPPLSFRMQGTDIQRKGIEIVSSGDITVICFNYDSASADGYLAMPTSTLGTTYVVASYKPREQTNQTANIAIISGNDGTNVSIHFNASIVDLKYRGATYGSNVPLYVSLGKLDAFHVSYSQDLSGTIITANKPISVVSGGTCLDVPRGIDCDFSCTFLLPVNKWGRNYVVGFNAQTGDLFRVFAYENNTSVRSPDKNGVISRGEFIQIDLTGFLLVSFINCSKPCQLVQYVTGGVDPSMSLVPSIEQFLPYYHVALFGRPKSFVHIYISLLIKESEKNGLVLNGDPLTDMLWRKIVETEYTYVSLRVRHLQSSRVNVFHSSPNVTFGLLIVGLQRHCTYSYAGGFHLTHDKNLRIVTSENPAPMSHATTTKIAKHLSTTASTNIPSVSPDDICPSEEVWTPWGVFFWPKTKVEHRSSVTCPYNKTFSVTRECQCCNNNNSVSWSHFNATSCPRLSRRSLKILKLSVEPITPINVVAVSKQTSNLSFPGESLSHEDVTNMADILERMTLIKEKVNEFANDVFNSIDNVLDARTDVVAKSQRLSNSSARILQSLNSLLEAINLTKQDFFRQTLRNYAVDLSTVTPRTFSGMTFSARLPKNTSDALVCDRIETDGGIVSYPSDTSIQLPRTIFSDSPTRTHATPQTVIFTFFKKAKFFQNDVLTNSSNSSRRLNSFVIAASIKSLPLSNLRNPVILTYAALKDGNKDSAWCVFWRFSSADWVREGCSFQRFQKDGRIVCHCNHLTNFAMLMSINVDIDQRQEKILGIISYIGCILSLIGLTLTLITIFLFKDLRRKVPFQILLNFCIALSLTLIVFLSAAERSKTSSLAICRAAAIALHYLVLVVFMWMATEAFNMYLTFVKVLPSYLPRFILKCCLISWGLPVVIVSITVGVALDSYGDEKYCRLHGLPFLVSFLTPIMLILLGNSVAFVLIFRSLLSSGSKVTTDRKATGYQRARQGLAIMTVLGLTWIFGVLAINDAKDVFQYLFCIFNSLQGLFVFVFYCVLPTRSRKRYQNLCKKNTSNLDFQTRTRLHLDDDTLRQNKNTKVHSQPKDGNANKRNPTFNLHTLSTSSSEGQPLTSSPPAELSSFKDKEKMKILNNGDE